ncbi:MAG: hypothetical protein B7Y49_02125 [Sphingomonas sp. 28-62-11]|nr:MAG: hypothetical protein B7Y49_02125 [Sphingomonas sp. 28-62-11]
MFLSRHRLYPGHVSRALFNARKRDHNDRGRRLQLQGQSLDYPIDHGDELNDAYLEFHPGSGNTLLKVKRRRYWYREHGNGLADLIVFGRQLPEVVCLGLDRDRYRLTHLVEHEYDPFYLKSDPLVRRMRNAERHGRTALILTLLPTWAEEHWGYSDGGEIWRE